MLGESAIDVFNPPQPPAVVDADDDWYEWDLSPELIEFVLHPIATPANIAMLEHLVSSTDSHGFTLLHAACGADCVDLVAVLIELGADVNARSTQRHLTPLMVAVLMESTASVEVLLQRGHPELSCQAVPCGSSVAHLAAALGNTAILSKLFRAHVNLLLRDEAGQTAFDVAKALGQKQAQLLLYCMTDKQMRELTWAPRLPVRRAPPTLVTALTLMATPRPLPSGALVRDVELSR